MAPGVIELQPKSSTRPAAMSSTVARLLGGVEKVVVLQQVEKLEAATLCLSSGCCKVETENRYFLKNAYGSEVLLEAREDSAWCCRNPCLCCDCVC